jgi:beta-phosphoglucomutase-like phosphatase (HAD superfamily)
MIKVVFFDVGNTLLRADPPVPDVFARVARRMGHDITVRDVEPVMAEVDAYYESEYLRDGDFWCVHERAVQIWLDMYSMMARYCNLDDDYLALAQDVYDEYFSARTPIADVHAQIIEELEYACENAPDPNPADKHLFTKAFAHGMLARIYAEPKAGLQDWTKVAEHCAAVESYGYELVEDYGEMWAYDETDAVRNTKESIFEITWTTSNGNWVWMMFHRNAYNPNDSYSWIKWITPSRDLIAAYDAEGDTERKNGCIVYDEAIWSNYYPGDAYAFMHKVPTNASSIILMRLAEIYLLHAEALAMTGDLAGATEYVNKVRARAGIKNIAVPSSQEAMIDAILHERRLELAFEGFRFFDLLRHGFERTKAIHDAMPQQDSYWQPRFPLTEETVFMPIPQTALDNNPSLVQNPGY